MIKERNFLTMKKIIALTLALCMVTIILTSCATMLSGEYSGKASLFGLAGAEVTYKFFGNKVTVTTKASVLGDFVPSKLGFEPEEKPLYMAVTTDYSGYMLFFFSNGKLAKVSMSAYETKTNRKKLIKAFSDKDEVVAILYIKEDTEVVLTSTAGRVLLVDTGAVSPKTTKDTAGVNVMTLKKYHKLQSVRFYKEGEFAKPHRYRTKTLPAAGATLSADDTAEQLSFM